MSFRKETEWLVEPWRNDFVPIEITRTDPVLVSCSHHVRRVEVRWPSAQATQPKTNWIHKRMTFGSRARDNFARSETHMRVEAGMYVANRLLSLNVVPETVLVQSNPTAND